MTKLTLLLALWRPSLIPISSLPIRELELIQGNTFVLMVFSFTEADWNPVSLKVCEEKGRDADGVNKYRGLQYI